MKSSVFSTSLLYPALAAMLVLAVSGTAYAQYLDDSSTLAAELVSAQPQYYTDGDGYTIIVGEVRNLRDLPLTDVQIWGGFYTDDSGNAPREFQRSNTILDVIPAQSTSPYVIRSLSQDLDIVGVSTNLLGFKSSASKPMTLDVGEPDVSLYDTIDINGSVTNMGNEPAQNTKVYALAYDALVPPRLLAVYSGSTYTIESGDARSYSFSIPPDEHISFVRVIAESDNYASNSVDSAITRYIDPLAIRDIAATDDNGNTVSTIPQDEPIYIRSTISGDGAEGLEYVYIVQIKQSGDIPYVEFIDSFEGTFTQTDLVQTIIEWTPSSSGLFYAETFVWSPEGAVLAAPGPLTLLYVR